MRPRYRLLAKRVLPTIKEELIHDMNQAHVAPHYPPAPQQQIESHHPTNAQLCAQTQHLSTQDYLLSICQLARPAFSYSEADWDAQSLCLAATLRASRAKEQHTLLLSKPQQPQVIQGNYKDLLPQNNSSCPTEADKETRDSSGMEDASNLETTAPGQGRTSAKPGPFVSDPLEELYGRADSFLTAARLARGGWKDEVKERGQREEGRETGQSSHPLPHSSEGCSAPHQSLSHPEGPRGPRRPEVCLKDSRGSQSPVQNSPTALQSASTAGALTHRLLLRARLDSTSGGGIEGCKLLMRQGIRGGRETGCERKIYKEKHAAEGRQTTEQSDGARQTGLGSQTGEVFVLVSGCRSTWRQSRRFRASVLPVIAEM